MNQYEAMFVFDPTFGAAFEACEAEVRRLMERAEAEILFCRKWDERRLAYRIKGRKRGVYVLVYFKAASDKIAPLERDVRLSENILRVLVLRAEGVTHEMMERAVASGPRHQSDDRRRGGAPSERGEPSATKSAARNAPAAGARDGVAVAESQTNAGADESSAP